VFASASPRRIGRGGPATLLEILAETEPALAQRLARTCPPPMRTFTGLRGYVRRAWGPGWALVGDAGYFKDPLSAHGITDALRDAELLARAVVAVLVDGLDEREAMDGYQATRDALSSSLFDVTDVIAGHRWADHEIGDLLLRLNAAMADELETIAQLPTPAVAGATRVARTG
jgi:2-polyprenyl-6-methoxyphenol hydroxylase-like FAD-dependent oxidoreductase